MSTSIASAAILATLLFVSTTMGHSQMRCAKYNPQTGDCYAPIRNQAVSFESEAYDLTTGTTGICQSPWTNPITASYANGAGCPDYAPCPAPMGTFTPGEVFSVQWLARNHAVSDQTPGNISLYLSPPISQTQTSDVSHAVMSQNKFCTAPFMSCGGDNGNFVNCSSQCTMPSNTAPGVYTLWWLWAWPGHTSVYATCADIFVVAGGASTPSAPSTTGKTLVAPNPSTTGVQAPSTTGVQAPSTTGVKAPSTTGAKVTVPSTTGSKPVSTPAQPSTTGSAPAVSAPATTGSAPASSPAPSSGSCVTGNMKCLSSETYSTCTFGSWAAAQSCATGTQCSPSGDHIYCTAGSKPTPAPITPPAQPTPSTTTTTGSSSSSCTLGYQRCAGSNTYQTCGNGRNGPTWAAAQPCQAGLQCHASSTANNIYCY